MKNHRLVNLLFIAIVAILVILGVAAAVNNQKEAQTSSLEGVIPTIDIALSVNQTIQASNSATETAQPTPTPFPPTAIPLPPTPTSIPAEFYIRDFKGGAQYYSLGCETRTAVDLAAYYGVSFYEFDFQVKLPLSDNPDLGFVGDVEGKWGQIPPYSYGVHAGPVADLMNEFGVEVEGRKGYTLEEIKESIAKSNPVIVWVIGKMEYSKPVEYTDKSGNITVVAPYEHVVILTGYNEKTVRYVSNGRWYDVENEIFLNSWGVLGNMALMHK